MVLVTILGTAWSFSPGNSTLVGQTVTQARLAADKNSDITISDTNFAIISQQVRDLKNPTFRALLRARMVSWKAPGSNAERRQAALSVLTEGLSDLCAHQEEVWLPTASWLYASLTRSVRNIDPAGGEAIIARCKLKKDESVTDAERDLSSAVNLLNDPAEAANAREKAKAAILTGQVAPANLLGHLLRLKNVNRNAPPDLLAAMLFVEEQRPGFITLRLTPFFTSIFLVKTNPAELQSRFLLTAIRSTRLRPEEFADPIIRSLVVQTLRGIREPTKLLAPALYPELATRLDSLGANTNAQMQREAAEERIRTSPNQLEQIEAEAEKSADNVFKRALLDRAARLALTQGKLRKAVDLAVASQAGGESDSSRYVDRILSDVTLAAIKQKEPEAADYAISRMAKPLNKANSLLSLSKYYAGMKEMEKSRTALNDSAKCLKTADVDNDKLKLAIAVAQSFLTHDRSAGYEAFQQAVEIINRLPAPEKEREILFYNHLMPIAEDLIESFRLLAAQNNAEALAIAQEIKLSELRVSALSGVYSSQSSSAAHKN